MEGMIMEGNEKSGVPLICVECSEEANKCDGCGDCFSAGTKIICVLVGLHFCDDECLKAYIKKDECFKMLKNDCTVDSEVQEADADEDKEEADE